MPRAEQTFLLNAVLSTLASVFNQNRLFVDATDKLHRCCYCANNPQYSINTANAADDKSAQNGRKLSGGANFAG
jgi:hypothetical protein